MKNENIKANSPIDLPELFTVHKKAGERKTCRLIRNTREIPAFLLDAGAVRINSNGTVTMTAVEGEATRELPFFLAWEKTEKLACGYGSWPKDNGWTTLDVTEDGRCFDKAADDSAMPRYKACRLIRPIALYFGVKESISIRNSHCWVKTSWGETRESQIPEDNHCEAILIEYEDGGVNILTLSEPSAQDYFVEIDGHDIGKLVDLVK